MQCSNPPSAVPSLSPCTSNISSFRSAACRTVTSRLPNNPNSPTQARTPRVLRCRGTLLPALIGYPACEPARQHFSPCFSPWLVTSSRPTLFPATPPAMPATLHTQVCYVSVNIHELVYSVLFYTTLRISQPELLLLLQRACRVSVAGASGPAMRASSLA